MLNTPQKRRLKEWLLASPSHRRIPWRHIRYYLPELDAKEDAIYTAFRELGYCRRTSKKKGFSDDPVVWAERKAFAEDAITWSRERLQIQMFTDELWANGVAHTTSYVTVNEDGSDRYLPECLQHKYRKAPAWMLHGTIVNGRKGPALFWEKEWGNMNSANYDEKVLSSIQTLQFSRRPVSSALASAMRLRRSDTSRRRSKLCRYSMDGSTGAFGSHFKITVRMARSRCSLCHASASEYMGMNLCLKGFTRMCSA